MHVEKFHKHTAGVILDHMGRSDSVRNCKRSNENIDAERTHLNYNLAAEIQPLPQMEFLKKRLSEVYVHGNASVHLFGWIVTAPKSLPEDEHEEFFKACFEKFKKDYGEKNIISAYVHRDETTPHMHFCAVPVVETEKGERLCAKEVITRNHLKKAHNEMEEYVSSALGHPVDILNGATKEGNKALADFKKGKAKEDLEKAEKEAKRIVSEAKTEAETTAKNYEVVSAVYENKMAVIEKMNDAFSGDELAGVTEHKPTASDPEHYFKVPPDIWYQNRTDKKTVEIYYNAQSKAMEHSDKLVEYEADKRRLIKENITLREELDATKAELKENKMWMSKFKKALKKLAEIIPNFNNIFKKITEEIDKEEKAIEREKNKIHDAISRTNDNNYDSRKDLLSIDYEP